MTVDNRVPYLSAGLPSPKVIGRGSIWMVLRKSARSLGGSADCHLESHISQISYRVVSGEDPIAYVSSLKSDSVSADSLISRGSLASSSLRD